MRKVVVCLVIFGLFLALICTSVAVDAEFIVPVEFTSIEMQDLGDFHGSAPGNELSGWTYAGGREPIVSPGWVVFPATGVYQFVVECKSQQLEPNDPVFAEFDVRLHVLDGSNNAGQIRDLIEVVGETTGDLVVAHGSSFTDDRKGEPWEKVTVTTMDSVTGEPMEIEAETRAQVEIWFTNDKWEDPNDRNLCVRSVAVLPPEGYIGKAVKPVSKMAVTWGRMKAE